MNLFERLLELKTAFEEKRKEKKWRLYLVDNEDNIDEIDKNVYCIIKKDKEDSNKKLITELEFYYLETKIKNGNNDFYKGVDEFKEMVKYYLTDLESPLESCEIDYGGTQGKASLRTAIITMDIDTTMMRYSDELDSDYEYELMGKLFLDLNGIKTFEDGGINGKN